MFSWRRRAAGRDPLTGFAGPARFQAASQRSLARGIRSGRHSGLLIIELNDLPSADLPSADLPSTDLASTDLPSADLPPTGLRGNADELLMAFARLLRGCVPPSGLPVRLDGARFAVVLPDLAFGEQAYEVAGRIAAVLGPIVAGGRLVTLAASVGVAVAASGELTHDEILHRAEAAMNRAKRHGPDTRWAAWQESDAA